LREVGRVVFEVGLIVSDLLQY